MDFGIRRLLIVAVSILVVMLVVGLIPACARSSTPNTEPEEDGGVKFVAHRGYSKRYLGNTEAAFTAAAELGFYGIETDIRKTKDGYYVCNHDATVEYADGTEKTISSTKKSTLLSKPLKNDTNDKEAYLCTFETYLQICKAGNKVAVIEFKDYFDEDEIESILSIIDAEYDRKKVSFISFYYPPLSLVKKADPTIPLQYLSQTENDNVFARCLTDGVNIDIKYTLLTQELVKTFHDARLTVNVWTVNDAATLEKATLYGADYITTDVYYE